MPDNLSLSKYDLPSLSAWYANVKLSRIVVCNREAFSSVSVFMTCN